MGLLAALAVRRVHVLVLAAPGSELLGMRAEAAVRRRGWLPVGEPEDADALVVCGGDGRLDPALDATWSRIRPPRARRRIDEPTGVEPAFDSIARVLADRELQRQAAAAISAPPPDAIDGVHHDRLGPVLADWPTGLVVDCSVHLGTVLAADAELLGLHAPIADGGVEAFALLCQRAGRVLRLAGWPAEALRLARSVDRVLGGAPLASRRRAVRGVERRVRGSATLRSGLGRSTPDVRAGLLALLADATRLTAGVDAAVGPLDPVAFAEGLPGRRFADVRLLAALDAVPPPVARG